MPGAQQEAGQCVRGGEPGSVNSHGNGVFKIVAEMPVAAATMPRPDACLNIVTREVLSVSAQAISFVKVR